MPPCTKDEFEAEITGLKERTKRDGKQTRTRLNERGREARGKGAKPPKVDEVVELRAEIARLQAWGNANAQTAKELLAENEAMGKVTDADDKMAELAAQNKQLRAQVATLTARNNGLLNSEAAAKEAAKAWQAKFRSLEKTIKRAA